MAYAAGNLPEGFGLVVATHISLCEECRAALESFGAVGGSVINTCDTMALSAGGLDATLALIDSHAELTPPPRVTSAAAVFPAPLQDYVGGDLDKVAWRSIGGGVKQAVLETSAESSVRLLSIPGGTAIPDHSHRGIELTLVLQGAFSDDDGRFARGDIEIADEHLEHTPIAEEGPPCICLAATDAPLKFRGWIPRIAQPFIGI